MVIESGDDWELRLGDYREVLADVSGDLLCADPPYSERTHRGHDDGATLANRGHWKRTDGGQDRCRKRRSILYEVWTERDVSEFCGFWSPKIDGWMVVLSDSDLCGVWRARMEAEGRTGFQPLPCVIPGMTVRLAGDGPSSWAIYANVARPKSLKSWGTLRGAYGPGGQGEREHIGGKPLWLMRALIRDYSRPGDIVVDPTAGAATTLLAAVIEGRRAIGAEQDPETFAKACKRLKRGYTPTLFGGDAA